MRTHNPTLVADAARSSAKGQQALAQWVERIGNRMLPVTETARAAAGEILDTPGRSLSDLTEVAVRDPVLALTLLRKVNALREGSGRDPVTIIDSAVNLLGRMRLQALLQGLVSTQAGAGQPGKVDDYLRIIDRCVLAADLSAHWAKERGNLNPAEMRVAGLLHGIGELALAWYANATYRRLRMAEHQGLSCGNALSRRLLGFSLTELARALAAHWRLPPTILAAMDATRYQEHRSLAPMLANELSRHVVDGWYSPAVLHCLEVAADYLGVSTGETTRQVHVVAVGTARSPYVPNRAPAARALAYLPGRIELPPGYADTPRPATALAQPAPPKPVPATVSDRPSSVGVSPTAPAAPPALTAAARPIPAPDGRPGTGTSGGAGTTARRSADDDTDGHACRPVEQTSQTPNASEHSGGRPIPPLSPEPVTVAAVTGSGATATEPTAPDKLAEPAAAAREPSPAAASAVVGEVPACVAGDAAALARCLERYRQILSGAPARPAEVLQLLLRGLHLGAGLPRVVVLSRDSQDQALVLRFQAGPLPGWPKAWRLSLSTPSVFERVLHKPQALKIGPALMLKHAVLFPEPIRGQVDASGFWTASLFIGSRAWGMVYAEPNPDADPDRLFRQFSETCTLAGRALAVAAAR